MELTPPIIFFTLYIKPLMVLTLIYYSNETCAWP